MYKHLIRWICSLTFGLMLVHMIVRCKIIYKSYAYTLSNPSLLANVFVASYNDVVYALGIGTMAVLLVYFFRNSRKMLYFLGYGYLALVLLHILIALVNVKAVRILGVPFNYQWLYYSDFLGNNDSKTAILANVSLKFFMQLLALSLVMGITAIMVYYGLGRIFTMFRYKKYAFYSITGFALLYLVAGKAQLANEKLADGLTANPVVAFISSCVSSIESSSNLFTMELPADFEPFPGANEIEQSKARTKLPAAKNAGIQNLILFVMESVPAEYVAGYNPKYDVTPNLKRYLNQSMLFSDIYAHIPSTHNALVSILGSLYPKISYESITQEHPGINWPTISSELHSKGYRTAFFQASDNKFARMNEFLALRQFDKVADYQTIPCNKAEFDSQWEYLDGVDEACMVDAALEWIPKQKANKPFFATLWTMQTHYPYFTSGPEKDYGVEYKDLNRYLNALQHSDAVFGKLMDELERRGLAASTLVVVVGDHGEAFGKHNMYGHASGLYEQNLHVPLLFINPVLYKGQKKAQIGGHIDIAPTIMETLGFTAPQAWQGTSLFDPAHSNRAYFLNPYSDYLFGYRTQDLKVIFNATSNTTEVYNLRKDKDEKYNLAGEIPDFVELSHKRLARWVQYHQQVVQQAVAHSGNKDRNLQKRY
ncbi:LTA synthase family protein [Pontibacter vulgaris]|uniref:LTA synthase family protein n=1 Tax=Pontibacter vulgaris TaxID=2905679 RepID=UPI001FA6D1C5|nr:sulfatase [Pontibacter vulgaris]